MSIKTPMNNVFCIQNKTKKYNALLLKNVENIIILQRRRVRYTSHASFTYFIII